eukprot:gene10531-14148_t
METEKNGIFVAVRIRPLSSKEIMSGQTCCCTLIDDSIVAIRSEGTANNYLKSQQSSIMEYQFDAAFDDSSTQLEVYEATAKKYIRNITESGQSLTVFAYGATGAGKTHTMLGNTRADDASSNGEAGIIPNAVKDLFDGIETKKKCAGFGETWQVTLSYVEVYNEQVYDLLEPTGKVLSVREDQERGIVVVAGSTEQVVATHDQVMELLYQGNRNRKTEATLANAVSSRSHAVLQLIIKNTRRNESGKEYYTETKLSLIDLAGSERASATNNRGIRLHEGANINKSLLALANCINTLAGNSIASNTSLNRKINVKYRDSKLTLLLKNSLEGNCNLVMIANINPADSTYEDSHNTLKYANRAKNIKVNPIQKEIVKETSWIDREFKMKEENNYLRDRVMQLEETVRRLECIITESGLTTYSSIQQVKSLTAKDNCKILVGNLSADGIDLSLSTILGNSQNFIEMDTSTTSNASADSQIIKISDKCGEINYLENINEMSNNTSSQYEDNSGESMSRNKRSFSNVGSQDQAIVSDGLIENRLVKRRLSGSMLPKRKYSSSAVGISQVSSNDSTEISSNIDAISKQNMTNELNTTENMSNKSGYTKNRPISEYLKDDIIASTAQASALNRSQQIAAITTNILDMQQKIGIRTSLSISTKPKLSLDDTATIIKTNSDSTEDSMENKLPHTKVEDDSSLETKDYQQNQPKPIVRRANSANSLVTSTNNLQRRDSYVKVSAMLDTLTQQHSLPVLPTSIVVEIQPNNNIGRKSDEFTANTRQPIRRSKSSDRIPLSTISTSNTATNVTNNNTGLSKSQTLSDMTKQPTITQRVTRSMISKNQSTDPMVKQSATTPTSVDGTKKVRSRAYTDENNVSAKRNSGTYTGLGSAISISKHIWQNF